MSQFQMKYIQIDATTIDSWRHDTPGTAENIHLNNAGASLTTTKVREAIRQYLDFEMMTGGYEAAEASAKDIEDFYQSLATLFHTKRRNFAFTSNATDSYARALSSVPLKKGDVILTTSNDYASNFLAFMVLRKRLGVKVQILPNTSTGEVDLDSVKKSITKYTPKILAVTHIPTNSGLIQPVAEIGKICREFENVVYMVDGCQAAGQIEVDIANIDCDFYSGSFRKFLRGPRGCGFLYASDHILSKQNPPMMLDMTGATWTGKYEFKLQDSARRYEMYEVNYALMMGARAALKYAINIGMNRIERRVIHLGALMRERWATADIPVSVLDRGTHKGAIVTLHIPNTDPGHLKKYLHSCHINCSVSTRSSALIDFDEKGVEWALRFSPHYYNTVNELDEAVTAVTDYCRGIA